MAAAHALWRALCRGDDLDVNAVSKLVRMRGRPRRLCPTLYTLTPNPYRLSDSCTPSHQTFTVTQQPSYNPTPTRASALTDSGPGATLT